MPIRNPPMSIFEQGKSEQLHLEVPKNESKGEKKSMVSLVARAKKRHPYQILVLFTNEDGTTLDDNAWCGAPQGSSIAASVALRRVIRASTNCLANKMLAILWGLTWPVTCKTFSRRIRRESLASLLGSGSGVAADRNNVKGAKFGTKLQYAANKLVTTSWSSGSGVQSDSAMVTNIAVNIASATGCPTGTTNDLLLVDTSVVAVVVAVAVGLCQRMAQSMLEKP